MAQEIGHLGYQGNLGFWGLDASGKPKQNYWNTDMSDAGQALYSDPQTGLQTGLMPDELLTKYEAQKTEARKARGGFLQKLLSGISDIGGAADSALSNIPGWGVTKDAAKVVWWPVDKVASGAYWLYSEGISQPLSTALLTSADAELSGNWNKLNPFADESTWGKNYDEAEHISPAQAFMNYENTAEASGKGTLLSGVTAKGADKLNEKDQEAVKRNVNRFMYDTDYWRNKQGWTYTVGTGALDFTLSMGADPAYAIVKTGAVATKGLRSTKILTEAEKTAPLGYSGFSPNALVNRGTEKIERGLAKTPEEASRSKSINGFFDWAEGKPAAEIYEHPIWGKGRRKNPEAARLSEMYAGADRADMPLMFRFAAGDNNAGAILSQKSQDNLIRMGKVQENRVLVDSVKFDSDLLQYFMKEERAGRGAPHQAPGIVGTSSGVTATGQLAEPPFPRPATPGPAQTGWDQTYGRLAGQSKVYRQASGDILKGLQGVRPMGGAASTSSADLLRAQQWKADQLDLMNKQIGEAQAKGDYFARALGSIGKPVEEFSPGESNIFGVFKDAYRQGPIARDTGKIADKNIARLSGTNVARLGKADAGFVARTFKNGFYSPSVKVIQSFGDRMPATFIDHNAEDAFTRVSDMLRGVPKLDPNVRLAMINQYSRAGDKISRSNELDKIHAAVIEHVAAQYDVNAEAASIINKMIKTGQTSTLTKLTGQVPNDQMFSAAKDVKTGVRADMVEDGNSLVIAPPAKSQLAVGQPLLDVKELERFFRRNSTLVNSLMQSGYDAASSVNAVADSLSGMWKALTLLRPGYILRSMSEEQAASAVKFGIMSLIGDSGRGGVNWALNRGQEAKAILGKGGYVPTTGKKAGSAAAIVRIEDPAAIAAAGKQGLKTTRVSLPRAWAVVEGRLKAEREGVVELEKSIEAERKSKNPNHALINDMLARIDDHTDTIGEFTDYAHELLRTSTDQAGRRLGEGTIHYRGQEVPQAFSGQWEHPIPRDQITSAHAMETMFARSEAVEMNRLIKTGSWTSIAPDNPTHMDAWLRGLNQQYRQDEIFRLVAEDPTLTKAKTWIKTPDGRKHMHALGPRARDVDAHLSNVQSTLDVYLPRGTGLQGRLARGEEITAADLRGAIRPEDFPHIHGEEFTSLTRKGQFHSGAATIDRLIEKGFNRLGAIPNDVMARQPIYLRAQEARMRQLIDQELSYRADAGLSDTLDPKTLQKMLEKSDKLARKDISTVVYDPTRTTASEALRFIAPFFSAHVDGLQRWGGLIAEKPEFLSTAAKIYNAPVAAGLVTDQNGREVGQDGKVDIFDPVTGKKVGEKFVSLNDRIVTLRLPGQTKNIKGLGKVPAGGFPIRLSALNTILPGDPWFNPGTGPFTQIAMSEAAKRSPQLGDFFQWSKLMPYGPSKNLHDPLVPKYLKDAWNSYTAGEAGNEAYQQALLQEWQRQSADYANGGKIPDMKLAEKNAKHFMFLDALTSWAMPFQNASTPLTGSPYQFFMDQYKSMQEIDPKNAKTIFYQKYGEDYFAFTADLSNSLGIQATESAQNTASMYGDLLDRDPDLASLIVGDVYNKGKFSTSVYRKQMDEVMGGKRVREKITAEAAIQENEKSKGWAQYNKYMAMVDAELIRSGFHSYNQVGAEPLADLKKQVVQIVRDGNDAWYEDYGTTNTTKLPLRIEAMKRMVSDKRLMSDPMRNDLKGLAAYLRQREILKADLNSRGGSRLSFGVDGADAAENHLAQPYGQNADIGMQLRTLQLYLVNSNLEFADIFHRYLEGDDLS